MTYRFLFDTNIVSDLVRNPRGRIALKIEVEGETSVATRVIVAAELRFGATKSGSKKLARQLDAVLGLLPILALEPPVDRRCGEIPDGLERAGTPIGANNLLIAAHAIHLGLNIVPANTREFKRVRGLRCVNWLV